MFTDLPTDAMTPDPREIRLPRWAQDTIFALRRAAQDQYDRAESAKLARQEGSRVYLDPHQNQIGLGDGVYPLRFVLSEDGNPNTRENYLDVRIAESYDIGRYVEISGGRDLIIRPSVTNVARVTVDSRR